VCFYIFPSIGGDIDNVLVVWMDIVIIESLERHCQLGGSLKGYMNFPYNLCFSSYFLMGNYF
jgi:hypothetical protein